MTNQISRFRFPFLSSKKAAAAGVFIVLLALVPAAARAQDSGLSLPSSEAEEDSPLPPGPGQAFTFEEEKEETFDFEKSPEELEQEARREAFDAALQGLLPLQPGEIRELLEHFDRTQESVAVPVYPDPRPEIVVETLSLDPGVKPKVVKTAFGHVTTINMLDTSGSPWPISNITWAGNFEIVENDSNKGSHILRISPLDEYARGNISISMLTLETPIILTLETSRDVVHYRFDAIIPEYGPFAQAPLIDQGITVSAGDEDISSVLQGIIPPGAQKLNVSGIDGRTSAYRFNGMTYVRTPLTLLSPGWNSSVSSADGMRVYAIDDAPVLLLSDRGRMVRARLTDREDILDE